MLRSTKLVETMTLTSKGNEAITLRIQDDGRVLVSGATMAPGSANGIWLVPRRKGER